MTDQSRSIEALEDALNAMLLDDEDITARGVVRRMDGVFKNASDITRHPERRAALERFQARQAELRKTMEKADKESKTALSAKVARLEAEVARVTQQRDLLIASHKAMLLAVGEVGGMKAWKKFFDRHQDVIEQLQKLGAMPEAEVVPGPAKRGPEGW